MAKALLDDILASVKRERFKWIFDFIRKKGEAAIVSCRFSNGIIFRLDFQSSFRSRGDFEILAIVLQTVVFLGSLQKVIMKAGEVVVHFRRVLRGLL